MMRQRTRPDSCFASTYLYTLKADAVVAGLEAVGRQLEVARGVLDVQHDVELRRIRAVDGENAVGVRQNIVQQPHAAKADLGVNKLPLEPRRQRLHSPGR